MGVILGHWCLRWDGKSSKKLYFVVVFVSRWDVQMFKLKLPDSTTSNHHFLKEIVWTAVRLWGSALESASRRLKEHRQIVLTAVERCGVALRYAVTWQNTL